MSSPAALAVTARRSSSPHTSMFLRMLWRAAVLRRGRAASALVAMVVAAAAATAMLNLYADVQAKLRQEFRGYGANVVVVAKDGQTLPDDALQTVNAALSGHGVAVPFGTSWLAPPTANRWWSPERISLQSRNSINGGQSLRGQVSLSKRCWGCARRPRSARRGAPLISAFRAV